MNYSDLIMTEETPSHTISQNTYTPPSMQMAPVQPQVLVAGVQQEQQRLTEQSQYSEQELDEEHTVTTVEGDRTTQALSAAGVSRPASPARAHGQLSQGVSAEHLSLSEALDSARLTKYEDAFRDLGCEIVQDLADLEEQDLMEIGMKRVEIVRLKRLVPNFSGGE